VPILFELRSLPAAKGKPKMDTFRGISASMIIECENGYLTGGRLCSPDLHANTMTPPCAGTRP